MLPRFLAIPRCGMGGWRMIDFRGSRFTDLLPENLSKQLRTHAFAYAVGRQIEKLCAYTDGIGIYAAVASLPEKILDYLALELRTPSYNEQFSVEVKRALIEGTLTFYMQMGTPAACNRIIEAIFTTGYIEEWFDYGGKPHHFRAYVGRNGGPIDPGHLEEFRRVLGSVKRLSSWLDDIITIATFDPEPLAIGGAMGKGYMETTLPEAPVDYHMKYTTAHPGGAFRTITTTAVQAAE